MASRPSRGELARLLSSLEPLPDPKPELEQYETPPELAARVLTWAFDLGDIEERFVADLGCGSGVLGLGAALLGAREVVCIDVDPLAVVTAWRNAWRLGVVGRMRIYVSDVVNFREAVDTVVMNPPFGIRGDVPDLAFLIRALKSARVVYSIHREGNADFLARAASRLGAELTHVRRYPFSIAKRFEFHRRKSVEVGVEVLRFERLYDGGLSEG